MPILSLIAAVARNGVVGVDNRLPWQLPEDLRYFKATTTGRTIIMGRKTYDSIGRPLPQRRNIVVTRNLAWRADGVETAPSLAAALALAGEVDEVFLIGGAMLYAEAIGVADRLYLTEIAADIVGDAYFPMWPREDFVEVRRQSCQGPDFNYDFVVYHRQNLA